MTETQPINITEQVTFVCSCDEQHREACKGEGLYANQDEKTYCILHFPADKDIKRFDTAVKRKLDAKDYNFQGVWFPAALDFSSQEFDSIADFTLAIFNSTADFTSAAFNSSVTFEKANFQSKAIFKSSKFAGEANFESAEFNDATFSDVIFDQKVNFILAKLNFADFHSTTFKGEAVFEAVSFSAIWAFFQNARFEKAANFKMASFDVEANFSSTHFESTSDFNSATFMSRVVFDGAILHGKNDFSELQAKGTVSFNGAEFYGESSFIAACFDEEVSFSSMTFGMTVDFSHAVFGGKLYFAPAIFKKDVIFCSATFKDNAMFVGHVSDDIFADESDLSFNYAITEKPERVSFHYCWLRPEWFLLIDPRKFEFNNVEWHGLQDELKKMKSGPQSGHPGLHVTYRQLATNSEENHRYDEASKFRFASMEAKRLEEFRGFAFWRLDWWYWLASCYGENVSRAFLIFLVVIILFTIGYNKTGFDHPVKTQPVVGATSSGTGSTVKTNDIRPLELKDAIMYSLNVAILQKPEPKPSSFAAKLLVWLETVLGPAQAALLALAVRRRFMR